MQQYERLQYYFQILSDINRLHIIKLINIEERTVSEIVRETNLSQPLVSHHLRILKNSQLLETKRDGPFIHYKLKNTKFLDILGLFEEVLPNDNCVSDYTPMFCCPGWWKAFNQK
ncbi:MAG TPA: metalloregulator ArsR/SmtB family transcription factor [Clostridia bacterium]